MADKLDPARRSENMRRIGSKNTKPEIAVRQLAHRLGYRFRLYRRDLPGKPDLVFPGRRKVILVHGCFWHQHGNPTCKDGRLPKSRPEYWKPKLRRNQERDAAALTALRDEGWEALVVWECEARDNVALEERLCAFLGSVPLYPG